MNNVEKYFFSIADGSKVFVFVVFGDGGLVNENVFVGVVSVDETVAVSNVEPLDDSGDRGGDDSFFSGGWRVSSGLVIKKGAKNREFSVWGSFWGHSRFEGRGYF